MSRMMPGQNDAVWSERGKRDARDSDMAPAVELEICRRAGGAPWGTESEQRHAESVPQTSWILKQVVSFLIIGRNQTHDEIEQ